MARVVGVRFRKAGKVYYFDPGQWSLQPGDAVVVETARGLEFGWVVAGPQDVPDDRVVTPLKQVVRKATARDEAQVRENEVRERQAMEVCSRKIAEHGLEMDLVDAEYTFDQGKIVFYFTAQGRVDFRELVRDLASAFHTRIELRQIGVRDEAKMLGGIGPCGRLLCCATFLDEFRPVSIRMAKQQNLSLNPSKISGLCGRLMCCLRFECESYEGGRDGLPAVGSRVLTPEGEGRVISLNPNRGAALVRLDSRREVEFPIEEVEEKKAEGEAPSAPPAGEDNRGES
ncbi:MAG: stage 0 sporulation family protein [Acetobacteraceae bacterium]|nr:stage 0 sporulation family protein [Acetobacteraceae bacterium]